MALRCPMGCGQSKNAVHAMVHTVPPLAERRDSHTKKGMESHGEASRLSVARTQAPTESSDTLLRRYIPEKEPAAAKSESRVAKAEARPDWHRFI